MIYAHGSTLRNINFHAVDSAPKLSHIVDSNAAEGMWTFRHFGGYAFREIRAISGTHVLEFDAPIFEA